LAADLRSKQGEWSTLFGGTAAGTQLGLAKKYLLPASSSSREVVPSIGKDSAKLVCQFAASHAASFSTLIGKAAPLNNTRSVAKGQTPKNLAFRFWVKAARKLRLIEVLSR